MIRYNRSAQLLYLIFFYCSVLVAQQDAPPWLIIKPTTDSDKYVGIGEASTNNPDYSLIAEQEALRSIALEIKAQISRESRRKILEINDIAESEFRDEFIVSTLVSIKGLVKKGDHLDIKNKRYYIYFEYSMSDHLNNIQETKKRAINLVQEYQSLPKDDFVLRLQKLVYTYESLFQVYGEDVFSNVNGRNVNLQSLVPSEIQK